MVIKMVVREHFDARWSDAHVGPLHEAGVEVLLA
jgi:hypothetical protein